MNKPIAALFYITSALPFASPTFAQNTAPSLSFPGLSNLFGGGSKPEINTYRYSKNPRAPDTDHAFCGATSPLVGSINPGGTGLAYLTTNNHIEVVEIPQRGNYVVTMIGPDIKPTIRVGDTPAVDATPAQAHRAKVISTSMLGECLYGDQQIQNVKIGSSWVATAKGLLAKYSPYKFGYDGRDERVGTGNRNTLAAVLAALRY